MMNISRIRAMDKYLGPVICSFLLTIETVYKYFKRPDNILQHKDIKKILLIKFFGMGSILLASPAVRRLKDKYPDAKVTILTLYANKQICEILPSIDDALYLKIDGHWIFLSNFLRIIFDIRRRNFDVIVNLEFLTYFSALVTLLTVMFTKGKIAIGFNSPLRWRNKIHEINVSVDHSRHITKIFAKVVSSLGVEDFTPSFEPERKALLAAMNTEPMKDLIKSNVGLAGCDFFICINISAGVLCLLRRWPKEYFAKIANELIKKPNIGIILIGGKEDIAYVCEFKKLINASSRIVDICGKADIKGLVGIFAESDLLITNDSGPLHLADIVGLATISFFGPETPHLYGPFSKKDYVFYEDLYCSPCVNIYNSKMSYCENNICLRTIGPERVLKVIEDNYLSVKNKL